MLFMRLADLVKKTAIDKKKHHLRCINIKYMGYMLLGLVMLYSMVHFSIIQHVRKWSKRSTYEKVVTVFALVSIALTVISIME